MSDSALLARFDDSTPTQAQLRVSALLEAIHAAAIEGVRNLHPAFRSLLVVYDTRMWTPQGLLQRLDEAGGRADPLPKPAKTLVLPVCSSSGFAPGLVEVCAAAGLERVAAIRLFTAATYQVAFLGFAPGFPYLLGLPPELAVPRLARPRTHIPAGSVGIAGGQAGIYPADTPGGWQIIGRTPFRLFDLGREPMSLLNTGDEVRFVVIEEARYQELSQW